MLWNRNENVSVNSFNYHFVSTTSTYLSCYGENVVFKKWCFRIKKMLARSWKVGNNFHFSKTNILTCLFGIFPVLPKSLNSFFKNSVTNIMCRWIHIYNFCWSSEYLYNRHIWRVFYLTVPRPLCFTLLIHVTHLYGSLFCGCHGAQNQDYHDGQEQIGPYFHREHSVARKERHCICIASDLIRDLKDE